jgi:hypothetical protein
MAFFSDHPGLREGFGEMVRKVPPTAGAVPPTSTALIRRRALAKDLLPSSYAKGIGFGEVVEKVNTSSKSGVKSCPRGAQVAFEDRSNQSDVVSGVLECSTKAAAAKILSGVVAETSASWRRPGDWANPLEGIAFRAERNRRA